MEFLRSLAEVWTLIAALAVPALLYGWTKTKSKTSIFAQDRSLEDVGLSMVSTIGDTGARTHVDGRTELRPPFGYRIIAPAIIAGFIIGYDYRSIMPLIGLTDPQLQTYAIYAFWALFAYTVFELNFRQRVIYDTHQISCWGVDLRRQDHDLADLVGIEVHEKRPALVMTFASGKRLYIPKHLTGRETFIAHMTQIIAENRNRGLSRPADGAAARAGF